MKFSLVLDVGRSPEELSRFLKGLEKQDHSELELLVVDRGENNSLTHCLDDYRERLVIYHLRTEGELPAARNLGVSMATGDVIAFPTAECWYPPGLLAQVRNCLVDKPYLDGVLGSCVMKGRMLRGGGRRTGMINKYNLRGVDCTSFTMFLRRGLLERVGRFDEYPGLPGARSGGEDRDFLLKCVQARARLLHEPGFVVHHSGPLASVIALNRPKGRRISIIRQRFVSRHR